MPQLLQIREMRRPRHSGIALRDGYLQGIQEVEGVSPGFGPDGNINFQPFNTRTDMTQTTAHMTESMNTVNDAKAAILAAGLKCDAINDEFYARRKFYEDAVMAVLDTHGLGPDDHPGLGIGFDSADIDVENGCLTLNTWLGMGATFSIGRSGLRIEDSDFADLCGLAVSSLDMDWIEFMAAVCKLIRIERANGEIEGIFRQALEECGEIRGRWLAAAEEFEALEKAAGA